MKVNYQIFLLKFTVFFIACFLCTFLQKQFHFSAVLSAAIVGFIGSFYHFSYLVEKTSVHAVFYSGAFCGMCSPELLPTPIHLLIVSLIGATLYLLTKRILNGFGGKMGAIAFLATLLLSLTRSLW